MAKKKVICDSDIMIDYWDNRNLRHDATKSILENRIGLDNVILSAITKFEPPDCLIAATSIVTGFELFAYNIKDFRFISNLNLFKHA